MMLMTTSNYSSNYVMENDTPSFQQRRFGQPTIIKNRLDNYYKNGACYIPKLRIRLILAITKSEQVTNILKEKSTLKLEPGLASGKSLGV